MIDFESLYLKMVTQSKNFLERRIKMKKSLLWVLVLVLSIAMIAVFSLVGCKAKAAAEEEAAPAVEEAAAEEEAAPAVEEEVTPKEGPFTIAMVVKHSGNPFYEAAEKGCLEALSEFGEGDELIFQGPEVSTVEGQIEIIESLITQNVDAISIAANDPDALVPVCKKAMDAGIVVTTWDSSVAPEGRQVFINQADMEQIGRIEVQMMADIIDYEGQIAILSAGPTMTNQNTWIRWMQEELKDPKYEKVELVAIVYGMDEREKSYTEAMGLFKSYPDLKGIISPTTVGMGATGRAIKDAGLVGKVVLTGLGLPSEMAEYIKEGICPVMALWNPIDLGYLATYVTRLLVSGEIKGEIGEKFTGGKLGEYEIVDEGNGGKTVLLGPPFKFNAENIDEWKDVY